MKKFNIKPVICVIAFLFLTSVLIAQSNNSVLFNPHNLTKASHTFPGKIGEGFNVVEVTLPSIDLSLGNNSMSFNQILEFAGGPDLTNSYINSTLNSLQQKSSIYAKLDLQLLGISFNVRDKNKDKIASFSLSLTEKAVGSLHFPKDLFKVLFEGNSDYAGETIAFSDFAMDLLYYHDIALGASIPVKIKNGIQVTPGLRFRYLMGVASVNTHKAYLDMFTEADGRYIDFNYDFHVNTSFPGSSSEILSGTGKGIGLDIGANVKINDMITADIAVNDIGFIQFDKDPMNHINTGNFHYEGIEIDLWETDVNEWSSIDTLISSIFDTEETNDAYRVSLEPKLSLMGTMTLMPMMTKKQERYFQHNIYLSYTQGFKDVFDKNTRPLIGVGYVYSLKGIFNIGPNLTFGGYSGFALGMHTSIKAGPFKFSLGSSDLSPLVMKNNGKGANLHTSFALAF